MSDYIQDCIAGNALLTEIDDYIDMWHEGSSTKPLHEFLGMSLGEYAAFVANEEILPLIITAHKEHIDFNLAIQNRLLSIPVTPDKKSQPSKLNRELKQKGHYGHK